MPDAEEAPRAIRFRNYRPRDADLATLAEPVTLESLPSTTLSAAQNEELSRLAAPSLRLRIFTPPLTPQPADAAVTLVPKKANWDLKRDLAPKLEVLERATQRALITLLRESMKGSEGAGGASKDLDAKYEGPLDPALLSKMVEGRRELAGEDGGRGP
jgi:cwf18 pre-mRNA splicing factor